MSDFIVSWEDHGPEIYKIYFRQRIPDLSMANRIYDMKVSTGLYDVKLVIDGRVYRHYEPIETDEQEI